MLCRSLDSLERQPQLPKRLVLLLRRTITISAGARGKTWHRPLFLQGAAAAASLRGQVSAESARAKVTRIHAEHERDKTRHACKHAATGLAASILIGATWQVTIGRTSKTESLKLQIPVSMCRPSVSRASQVWSASAELAVLQAGAVGVLSVLVLRNLRRRLLARSVQTRPGGPAESRRCRRSSRQVQAPDTSRRKWAVAQWGLDG